MKQILMHKICIVEIAMQNSTIQHPNQTHLPLRIRSISSNEHSPKWSAQYFAWVISIVPSMSGLDVAWLHVWLLGRWTWAGRNATTVVAGKRETNMDMMMERMVDWYLVNSFAVFFADKLLSYLWCVFMLFCIEMEWKWHFRFVGLLK